MLIEISEATTSVPTGPPGEKVTYNHINDRKLENNGLALTDITAKVQTRENVEKSKDGKKGTGN